MDSLFLLITTNHVNASNRAAATPKDMITPIYAFFHFFSGSNMSNPSKMFAMLILITAYPTAWWYTFQ